MILVIGEALIDLIGREDSGGQYQAVVGGANANVALALAVRGEKQAFLGRISTDGFGNQIRNTLLAGGVNLDYAITAAEQTSLAVATISQSGSASYSFYINGTADWAWSAQELPDANKQQELGAVCIQYGCLTMAIEPGLQVVQDWLEKHQSVTRSHDLNIRPSIGFSRERELARVLRINEFSDIIKASDADIEWLYDLPEGSDIDFIAHEFASEGRLVIITRGGAGASLYRNGERIDVAAPKISLVDTVGAGDTFMANFLAELNDRSALGTEPRARLASVSSEELAKAARVAAVAAGIVCERAGCKPPTKAETLSRVD